MKSYPQLQTLVCIKLHTLPETSIMMAPAATNSTCTLVMKLIWLMTVLAIFPTSHATEENCTGEKRMQVFCFLGLWYDKVNTGLTANSVDKNLCSSLIFAYIHSDVDANNKWTLSFPENHGMKLMEQIVGTTDDESRPMRYLASIGGYGDWDKGAKLKYQKIARDPEARTGFLNELSSFLRRYNLHGIDFFWNRINEDEGGDKYKALKDLSTIAKEMCGYLRMNGFFCSITLRLFLQDLDERPEMFDVIKEIISSADVVHVWTADIVGGPTTLIPDDMLITLANKDPKSTQYYKQSVNYIVDYLKRALGSEKQLFNKLSMVIPLQWNSLQILSNGAEVHFNEKLAPQNEHPISDPGLRYQYPYFEVCKRVKDQVWQQTLTEKLLENEFPVAYSRNFQGTGKGVAIPYVNEDYANRKVKYARKEKFGAVSVFQIGADDIEGWCFNKSYPILNAVSDAVGNCRLY